MHIVGHSNAEVSTFTAQACASLGRVLEAGMIITVEPGCYFNEFTMRPALADASLAHLLVPDRIEPLMVRAADVPRVSHCS